MNTVYLAAGSFDANTFWDSQVGHTLSIILGFIGVFVVVVAGVKVIKEVVGGNMGKAVKAVLGAAVLAAIMFRPELITSLINVAGNVVDTVIGTAQDVIGDGSGTTDGTGGA